MKTPYLKIFIENVNEAESIVNEWINSDEWINVLEITTELKEINNTLKCITIVKYNIVPVIVVGLHGENEYRRQPRRININKVEK